MVIYHYQVQGPPLSPDEIFMGKMMESCAVKGTISCVLGGALGVVMGLFTASLDPSFTMVRNN